MRDQFSSPTRELASFLKDQFALSLPQEWNHLLRAEGGKAVPEPLARPSSSPLPDPRPRAPRPQEPTFAGFVKAGIKLKNKPRMREDNYFGFNIIMFKGMFFGLCRKLGPVDLLTLKEKDLARLEKDGLLFRSTLVEEVKMEIAAQQLTRFYETMTGVRHVLSSPLRCFTWLRRILSWKGEKIAR
jgi:hypothetical protein